ncbi:MAG: hypothetical protein II863_01185 [Kiritimatiellae bacterium]|nr:hypothetical protein [Kiritimatiellia bacterium]
MFSGTLFVFCAVRVATVAAAAKPGRSERGKRRSARRPKAAAYANAAANIAITVQ